MQRHPEDLDNGGHRHNLCIRGPPESVAPSMLESTVVELFNSLLETLPEAQIAIERLHCTLRLCTNAADPLQDIVCRLVNFWVEELLRRARKRSRLLYKEHELQLYQDLSLHTL